MLVLLEIEKFISLSRKILSTSHVDEMPSPRIEPAAGSLLSTEPSPAVVGSSTPPRAGLATPARVGLCTPGRTPLTARVAKKNNAELTRYAELILKSNVEELTSCIKDMNLSAKFKLVATEADGAGSVSFKNLTFLSIAAQVLSEKNCAQLEGLASEAEVCRALSVFLLLFKESPKDIIDALKSSLDLHTYVVPDLTASAAASGGD